MSREVLLTATYDCGKIDYLNNGKRSCPLELTWMLIRKDGALTFSMTGNVWNHLRTDMYTAGQIIDTVKKYSRNPVVKDMVKIWERWHLNDMNAGSPRQRKHLVRSYNYTYEEAVRTLEQAGLNPDTEYLHNGKPYRYGSAWLTEELPDDVVNTIVYYSFRCATVHKKTEEVVERYEAWLLKTEENYKQGAFYQGGEEE